MLFVLNETSDLVVDPIAVADRAEMLAAAVAAGCAIIDFQKGTEGDEETWQRLIDNVPQQRSATPVPALWLGFIPSVGLYETVYNALDSRGLRLLNTPEEHSLAIEFDRAYPLLLGITPETVVLHRPEDWRYVEKEFDYPVFVRGAVRSRKSAGWNACVAESREELIPLVNYLFASPFRSRGSVLVRRLISLRHTVRTQQGFPKGREYRVFLYQGNVLGWGYYWEGGDPFGEPDMVEQEKILSLAQEATYRLAVPFLAVDIGQVEDGTWIVIELGDAQSAGHAQTPLQPLWESIVRHCGSQQ